MELLRNDLKFYYGYNDYLIERFTELFPIDQYVAFFEANEHPSSCPRTQPFCESGPPPASGRDAHAMAAAQQTIP